MKNSLIIYIFLILRSLFSLSAFEFAMTKKQLKLVLEDRAIQQSCKFIEENSDHLTNYYDCHWELRKNAFKQVEKDGLLLEFGVNRGRSANYFSKLLTEIKDERKYYGFDTFRGLTEDWGGVAEAGLFDRKGIPPSLNSNVELVTGDILKTLEGFLNTHSSKIAFIHIDTDTYTPCEFILNRCRGRLANGSIILFDELLGYLNYKSHEYRALLNELPRESYRFVSFGVSHNRANLIKAAIQIVDDSLLK